MENGLFYRNLSLDEYRGLVKTIAQNRKQELQVLFDLLIEKFGGNNWCLILVGSDGKQERHPQSKTEVVLLCRDSKPKDEMKETIKCLISPSTDPIEFEEIKTLDNKEDPFSFYNGQSDRCYPDRILNSNFLLGDDDIFIQARRQVLLEMSEQGKLGKKIREELRTQLKGYKKALISGQYRHQIIFDENQGKTITEAYLWFLREYHKAQELFKNSNRQSVAACQFNQQEFEQYKQVVLDFIDAI